MAEEGKEEKSRKRISKLVLEELESKKKLAELQKTLNQDIATYLQTIVNVYEGKKKIKEIDEEIAAAQAELDKNAENMRKKEVKALKKIIAGLEKKKKEMKKINEQAQKLNNLWISIGNSVKKQFLKTLDSLNDKLKDAVPGFSDIMSSILEADLAMKETARDMGLAGASAEAMKEAIGGAASYGAALGVDVAQMARAQSNFADATGRAAVFSKELNMELVQVARGTGLSSEDAGIFAANLDLAGMSMNSSLEIMTGVVNRSAALGLNVGSVVKKLKESLPLMNKMHFKDGIKGLEKLIQISETFRIEMTSIEQLTNKLFRPEGAIELAANLQMMGGAFAQMGDPLSLMYQARNTPEELAENIAKATAQSIIFNKKTGEFKLSALEIDRLRQVSEMTGISLEELTKSGIQAAKALQIKEQFGFKFDPKAQKFLSSVGAFGKKGFEITMDDGSKKLLKDMSKSEISAMMKREKDLEARAKLALSFDKAFTNFMNSMKMAFLPLLELLEPLVQWIADVATYWSKKGKIGKMIFATMTLVALTMATTFISVISAGLTALSLKAKALARVSGSGMTRGGGMWRNFFRGLRMTPVSKILAFGAAMVMVGAAVAIAAVGMAELVKAFSGLDIAQIVGATVALGLLGVGLLLLIPAITLFATTAGITAGPVMALGFALLMIGGACLFGSNRIC